MKMLNQDGLKLFALFAMVVDHIAQIFMPETIVGDLLRATVGRTVFPIFCILLAQHLAITGCFEKYIKRLTVFAVISQIVLFPFLGWELNILFSLLLATLFIALCHKAEEESFSLYKKCFIDTVLFIGCASLSIVCSYEVFGFLYIVSLYQWFKFKQTRFAVFTLLCAFLMNWKPDMPVILGISSFLTVLTLLFFHLCGKRFLLKWYWFYLFYPAHLAFLYGLKDFFS